MHRLEVLSIVLIYFGSVLITDTEGRAVVSVARRDTATDLDEKVHELEVSMTEEEKELFEHDVHELEHAIQDEITLLKEPEIQPGHEEEVINPANLDKEVTVHNEKRPWYVRLGRFLKRNLHEFVQFTAKKVINEIVIPKLTNAIFSGK